MRRPISLGVEQEYFLVDPTTGHLRCHGGAQDIAHLEEALGTRFCQEFHACMVETRTPVAHSVAEAVELARADRRDIARAVKALGLAVYPAGTHPEGFWRQQQRSPSARYAVIFGEIGVSARRALYSGLHVHVGIDEDEDRIRVVRGLVPYLPLFLGLSSSSPFWEGERTGYQSFRTRAQGEFPRSGIPPSFRDWAEYRRYIALLECSDVAEASTKVWWDVRPSGRYPTVEVRVADMMPSWSEVAALIALIACATVHIAQTDGILPSMDGMSQCHAEQNRWLAQRDGASAVLIDNELVRRSFRDRLADVVAALSETAEELECTALLARCLEIAERNTSAGRQMSAYDDALRAGASVEAALHAVRWSVLDDAALI